MKEATKRSIFRWVHLVFAIPIIGYIYSPFANLPDYAPVVRYVAFPVIALSGLWMWKGQWLRGLWSRRRSEESQ
jgi:thiosulfate reductase cytochrome b subunit